MKSQTKTNVLFDPSLTPYNARQKGYNYIDDVIYDLLNPDDAMKDIFELSRQFHCKLGTPNTNSLDFYFGLYLPIQQKNNE